MHELSLGGVSHVWHVEGPSWREGEERGICGAPFGDAPPAAADGAACLLPGLLGGMPAEVSAFTRGP